ncbi:hypothetical protein PIB30_078961 [Stylosanthes scabra]|uniref:Uncharacterized protein n=1 Tax=Stylosanthes scabra TaxID=79078 RepID=A0ABU6QQN5_9FABA|nr:hypothetical protein [Stylosanthes scabra]
MGSGVMYYEYEKREKFEDYDMKFDPDRPYEIPIEALMADKVLSSPKDEKSSTRRSRSSRCPTPQLSPRGMPTAHRERSTSSVKGTSYFRYGVASSSLRKPRSWELIPPSEGWMCEGDEEEKIGGMEPSVNTKVSSEEDPEEEDPEEEDPEEEEEEAEEEEDSEEGIPASPSLPMDIDAKEDYQRYIEELGRRPEPTLPRSNQAFVPDVPVEASDRLSDGHNTSSYDLSGVWPTPSSGPSP